MSLTNFAGFLDLGAEVAVPLDESPGLMVFAGLRASVRVRTVSGLGVVVGLTVFDVFGETGSLVELDGVVGLAEELALEDLADLLDLDETASLAALL